MTMTTATSTLEAAREDLSNRVAAAETAEDWPMRGILSPLYDVADMVCRIGDHTHSSHYQASKSTPLVHAALRVRAAAFERYASDIAEKAHDASSVLCDVDSALTACLWTKSRTGAGVYESDASELRTMLAKLTRFVDEITANPEADPED